MFVAGCTSVVGAEFVHAGDAHAQTAQALAERGGRPWSSSAWASADVVQTRILVTDISRWQEYGRAHREAFGDTMPAATMIEIAGLVDPRMLVEVEAVAYRPGIGS